MPDQFAGHIRGRPACASRHVALASGATDLFASALGTPDSIVCQTAGSIAITDELAVTITYACVAGQILDIRPRAVNVASGSFVAWYI